MNGATPSLITISLSSENQKLLTQYFEPSQLQDLDPILDQLLELPNTKSPTLIAIGPTPASAPILEIIQLMRMHYPSVPTYFLTSAREGLDKKLFLKNGFTDVFLMPFDRGLLETKVRDEISLASAGQIKSYKPVKLVDIEAGIELGFETRVFLPLNQKYVKFSGSDQQLDSERIRKLQNYLVGELFVEKSQMQKFYDFSAQQLRKIGQGNQSETEKKEKMSSAVRNLLGGLFTASPDEETHENGKHMMENCQQIVKSFILGEPGDDQSWYKRLMEALSHTTDSYSHAGNVSTFAALFSIGTRIGKPDELALAGLLHDIGLTELPAELQLKSEEELTVAESERYYRHAEHSVNLAKKRKISIPEKVQKMILQHHERHDGKGFPNRLSGDRILPEAQLLRIADLLDEMIAVKPGRKVKTPHEAIVELRKIVATDVDRMYFDPKLLDQILTLFPK